MNEDLITVHEKIQPENFEWRVLKVVEKLKPTHELTNPTELLLALHDVVPGETILHFGTIKHNVSIAEAMLGANVTVVDHGRTASRLANIKATKFSADIAKAGGSVNVVQESAEKFTKPLNTFDRVRMEDLFFPSSYEPDSEKIIENAFTVIKKGGSFYVTDEKVNTETGLLVPQWISNFLEFKGLKKNKDFIMEDLGFKSGYPTSDTIYKIKIFNKLKDSK